MKFNIEIDCTPEEARRLFGLPDVAVMNEELVAEFQARLREAFLKAEPDALMQQWLKTGMTGFEQMQKVFWSNLSGSSGDPGGRKK